MGETSFRTYQWYDILQYPNLAYPIGASDMNIGICLMWSSFQSGQWEDSVQQGKLTTNLLELCFHYRDPLYLIIVKFCTMILKFNILGGGNSKWGVEGGK